MTWQPKVSLEEFVANHHLTLRCNELVKYHHEEIHGGLSEIFGPASLQIPNKGFNLENYLGHWCREKVTGLLRREWAEANGLYVGIFLKVRNGGAQCFRLVRFIPFHEDPYADLQIERVDTKSKTLHTINFGSISEVFENDPTPVAQPVVTKPLKAKTSDFFELGALREEIRLTEELRATRAITRDDPGDLRQHAFRRGVRDTRWNRDREAIEEMIRQGPRGGYQDLWHLVMPPPGALPAQRAPVAVPVAPPATTPTTTTPETVVP